MSRLDGKIALITGAASGFGAATGKVFAREGAKVGLTDKNEGGVQAVARCGQGQCRALYPVSYTHLTLPTSDLE